MINTGKEIATSNREVIEAVFNNDHTLIVEMLEGFNFVSDCTPPHFDQSMRTLASTALIAAAAAEDKGTLSEEFAQTLISYTGGTVEAFNMLIPISMSICSETSQCTGSIPKKLRKALRENDFNQAAVTAIERLDREQLLTLVRYLASGEEIQTIKSLFTAPIAKSIYRTELIPRSLLLAYMAATLKEPIGAESILPSFGDFLGAMLADGLM